LYPHKGGGGSSGWDEAYLLWPAELIPWDDFRAEAAADDLWRLLQPSLNLERDHGSYEVMSMLTLAKVWKHDPEKLARVQEALVWEATVPTNELGHFGKVWMKSGSDVVPGETQPHVWHHALFYLAALEAFGEK